MTELNLSNIIKTEGALLHKRWLAHFPRQISSGEVVRMWKKRLAVVFQILVYLAVILYAMTIDAC